MVSALKDQQFLIITLSVFAPPDNQSKLVAAAAKAGVAYIMPNCYGTDPRNESLVKEGITSTLVPSQCKEIEDLGVGCIPMICNLWYEYSLSCGPIWCGFDFKTKHLIWFDDGNTKINMTTWEQCARALAALVSLPELPQDENDQSPTVNTWRNKPLYISSFLISQRDMFNSWKRISGDTDADWTFSQDDTKPRYQRGLEKFKESGERMDIMSSAFARVFYPGDGDYESKYGLANRVLGLPQEDLDERTKVAKGVVDSGKSYLDRFAGMM